MFETCKKCSLEVNKLLWSLYDLFLVVVVVLEHKEVFGVCCICNIKIPRLVWLNKLQMI